MTLALSPWQVGMEITFVGELLEFRESLAFYTVPLRTSHISNVTSGLDFQDDRLLATSVTRATVAEGPVL